MVCDPTFEKGSILKSTKVRNVTIFSVSIFVSTNFLNFSLLTLLLIKTQKKGELDQLESEWWSLVSKNNETTLATVIAERKVKRMKLEAKARFYFLYNFCFFCVKTIV